jgi:hypothetical protein
MSIESPVQENAMTEIALALAMAFFSLMVLTLISMGVAARPGQAMKMISLAPSTVSGPEGQKLPSANKPPNDLIIIFDGTRFLDTDLRPVNPETVSRSNTGPARRVVLAFKPAIPLNEAMAARMRLGISDLVVSTLDDRWLKAIEASR